MNFGEALQALKDGKRVKRESWGGYWFIFKDAEICESDKSSPVGFKMGTMIAARLKDNDGYAPAQPYQQDLLAEDWQIVD